VPPALAPAEPDARLLSGGPARAPDPHPRAQDPPCPPRSRRQSRTLACFFREVISTTVQICKPCMAAAPAEAGLIRRRSWADAHLRRGAAALARLAGTRSVTFGTSVCALGARPRLGAWTVQECQEGRTWYPLPLSMLHPETQRSEAFSPRFWTSLGAAVAAWLLFSTTALFRT
jgi:hypothetical protein